MMGKGGKLSPKRIGKDNNSKYVFKLKKLHSALSL